MPGMWLGLPRAWDLLVASGTGLNTNFLAKYQLTSVYGCRWRLKCTSIPRGTRGHRVRISCCFVASRDADGTARGTSEPGASGVGLGRSTCTRGRAVCRGHPRTVTELLRWPGNGLSRGW